MRRALCNLQALLKGLKRPKRMIARCKLVLMKYSELLKVT